MNLFITGGAGFIGSNFVRLVLERTDWHVTVIDALTYAGHMENLPERTDRLTFIAGDITWASETARSIPRDTDAIVNFAAESHVDRSIVNADPFVATNVVGTANLLKAARQREGIRFLQVSTDEVMGSLAPSSPAFTEESPYDPRNSYAATKAAAEMMVRAYHHNFGLDTVITRSGNNYGPRQFPEKFIPVVITRALRGERVPVYGDGMNVRDWIYVGDHCEALLEVLINGRPGGIYNIGARNALTNLDVARAVLACLEKPASLIEMIEDRPGHDREYRIDPSRIERELDWRAKTGWELGIYRTVAWYKNNPGWIEAVTENARCA